MARGPCSFCRGTVRHLKGCPGDPKSPPGFLENFDRGYTDVVKAYKSGKQFTLAENDLKRNNPSYMRGVEKALIDVQEGKHNLPLCGKVLKEISRRRGNRGGVG